MTGLKIEGIVKWSSLKSRGLLYTCKDQQRPSTLTCDPTQRYAIDVLEVPLQIHVILNYMYASTMTNIGMCTCDIVQCASSHKMSYIAGSTVLK